MAVYTKERREKEFILAEETVNFGGMLLRYRLFACESNINRFCILITKGRERSTAGLGNDINRALRFYNMVVGGRVTPCGLQDVMYDLNRSV